MDQTIVFGTDIALLTAFDPSVLDEPRPREFEFDPDDCPEARRGDITLISLEGDGLYRVRVTDGGLTPDERDYATNMVGPLCLRVDGGRLFVGQGESLIKSQPRTGQWEGAFVELANGVYDVTAYAIDWRESWKWYGESTCLVEDAPPDYVLVIRARNGPPVPLDSVPRLDTSFRDFLFESSTRLERPEEGMLLKAWVNRTPQGFGLSACGPWSYQAVLEDYSLVECGDRIFFKVAKVDHPGQTIVGRYVEKVGRSGGWNSDRSEEGLLLFSDSWLHEEDGRECETDGAIFDQGSFSLGDDFVLWLTVEGRDGEIETLSLGDARRPDEQIAESLTDALVFLRGSGWQFTDRQWMDALDFLLDFLDRLHMFEVDRGDD